MQESINLHLKICDKNYYLFTTFSVLTIIKFENNPRMSLLSVCTWRKNDHRFFFYEQHLTRKPLPQFEHERQRQIFNTRSNDSALPNYLNPEFQPYEYV